MQLQSNSIGVVKKNKVKEDKIDHIQYIWVCDLKTKCLCVIEIKPNPGHLKTNRSDAHLTLGLGRNGFVNVKSRLK